MTPTPARTALVALVAIAIATPAVAQGPQAAPATPEPGSPEALMAEYQEVQGRLGRLQVQAIQENSELEARRTEIDGLVTAAMMEINPDSEAQIGRLSELSEQAVEAQRAQDAEAMQAIMTEAMSLRSELDAAQTAAVQREDVQAEIQAFEADLMVEVREIDPDADALVVRLEELTEILSAAATGNP